jgi:hypothetical protein
MHPTDLHRVPSVIEKYCDLCTDDQRWKIKYLTPLNIISIGLKWEEKVFAKSEQCLENTLRIVSCRVARKQ